MKKVLLWIIFVFVALFVSMKISVEVQNKILFFSDNIKRGFLNLNSNMLKTIQRHFYQAEQIKQLSDSLRDKQQIEYLLDSINSPLRLNQATKTL